MSVAARVRVAGPLTRYIEGFAAELTAHGYTDLSLANQLRLMADLSRWLQATRTPVDEIDHDVVDRFLTKRRQTHTQFFSKRALAPLLRYLETVGAVSLTAVEQRPLGQLLREYERYLVEERAVLPARRQLCVAVAAAFIDGKRVAGLTAKDVTRFVDARAGRPGLAGVLGALRSVLRFLFVASKTRLNLVAAVPAMPRWRLGRLGLRAGEVAALQLDDFDWPTGELLVRGKGRVLSRLPIPVDVGEAMVACLRRATRNQAARAAFVRSRAPYDAVTPGTIVGIAKTALRAAGTARGGAHRLRHTAATQMLRGGASMTEVAQVLRHRHVDTTAIYAKVDHDALCTIARAWPVDAVDALRLRELAHVWPGGAV